MAEATSRQRAGSENLKPFKPGQSGNPLGINGATKRRAQLQEICQKVLGKPVDIMAGGKPLKVSGIEAVCIAMRNEAIKGDVGAATWCRDTAYGKPVQAITGDLNVNATVSMSQWAARMNGKVIPKAGACG